MIKKNTLSFILLLGCCISLFSQELVFHYEPTKISKPIKKAVKKMAAFKELHSSAVGYAGQKTEQYRRFDYLWQNASAQELLELCEHPAPCVRVYAFWSLAKKEYAQLEAVFMAHAADTQSVLGIEGCFPMEIGVIDWMTWVVQANRWDMECKKLDSTALKRMEERRAILQKTQH